MNVRYSDWAPVLTAGGRAEAYLEDTATLSLRFEDSRLTGASSGRDAGAGLRYLCGPPEAPETVHGSVDSLDPAAARALADRLLARRPRRPPPPDRPVEAVFRPYARRPDEVPMEEKVALLAAADRAARACSPRVSQVQLIYTERVKRYAVLSADGARLAERVSIVFIASVTAERDGLLQSGSEVLGGPRGFELFEAYDPAAAARRAARTAVEKLDAPVARAGEMAVVLAASAGGTFVHEAVGHSLEADHVQEGSSPHFAGRLGRLVAHECLTVIDDPTLPFIRGSYPFDDEGSPARPTPLIREGVLVDYLYDHATAARDGRASNAHGRRESFRHRPIPRMSNIYIAPGPDDPAAILKELREGLLVTKMGGGEVNTATGEFLFGVDEGFWVEGGKVRHRVRDANMLGVGPDVLKSIDRVGWDIGWSIGTCGKLDQGVPVADGQPTLRIPKLLIGGAA